MADFRVVSTNSDTRRVTLVKASATVIEAGDMVTLDAGGLAIKAVAGSTSIAFTEVGAGNGETSISIIADKTIVFEGTADANFAAANRGAEVDLVVNTNNQEIDLGTSTTDIFKVVPSEDAGTVGSALKVRVVINKFLI